MELALDLLFKFAVLVVAMVVSLSILSVIAEWVMGVREYARSQVRIADALEKLAGPLESKNPAKP